MTTTDPIIDPRPWLDAEYVVTLPEANVGNNLAAALGVARATLHRRELLPSGAVVYRAQSTGPVRVLCGIADKLNRQHAADRPMPEQPESQPIPPVRDERELKPHSRACGIQPHDHGPRCSPNCPTCHGNTPSDVAVAVKR